MTHDWASEGDLVEGYVRWRCRRCGGFVGIARGRAPGVGRGWAAWFEGHGEAVRGRSFESCDEALAALVLGA